MFSAAKSLGRALKRKLLGSAADDKDGKSSEKIARSTMGRQPSPYFDDASNSLSPKSAKARLHPAGPAPNLEQTLEPPVAETSMIFQGATDPKTLEGGIGIKPGNSTITDETDQEPSSSPAAAEVTGLLKRDVSVVETLAQSARLDALDSKGNSALHIAAARDDVALCHALIEAGADRHRKNHTGSTPRDLAQRRGHLATLHFFQQLDADTKRSDGNTANGTSKAAPPPWVSSEETPLEEAYANSLDRPGVTGSEDWDLEAGIPEIEFEGEFEVAEEEDSFISEVRAVEWTGEISAVQNGSFFGDEKEDSGSDDWFSGYEKAGGIEGEDIRDARDSNELPDALRPLRSFAEVRHFGRRSHTAIIGPVRRGWYCAENSTQKWTEEIASRGYCVVEDIEDLIHQIEGDFPAEELVDALKFTFREEGIWKDEASTLDVNWVGDAEDIADVVQSICNGSNIRPGVEQQHVTKRNERRMVRRITETRSAVLDLLSNDGQLVQAVIFAGNHVLQGKMPANEMTSLFKNAAHETEQVAPFLSALLKLEKAADTQAVFSVDLTGLGLTLEFLERLPSLADGAKTELRGEFLEAVQEHRAAREEMLLANLPALRRIAARMMQGRASMEDAFQDGFFGLDRSLDGFNEALGYRFMTYSQFGMRQAINRAMQDFNADIRIPAHLHERLAIIDKAIERFEALNGRLPELHEFPHIDGLTVEDLKKAMRAPRTQVPFEPAHLDRFALFEENEHRFSLQHELGLHLREFLDGLTERQKEIIVHRFGLENGEEMTLEQLGRMYGVTRERIRQIEAKALDYLRHPVRLKLLREYL
ncbi:sigma-70 family RNA polymerase sigma factor [Ruegeria atlantica]|uniref:sigma-70 family RNA polymerase sigma factor n=1 Tax=Ruegeria atlantica TaxID=81569 RepID=UPI002495599A|nr:sigma-70 family RNA polymerase sigma factor [Ruegeria atlantica]